LAKGAIIGFSMIHLDNWKVLYKLALYSSATYKPLLL
jgi:hypothetical protein